MNVVLDGIKLMSDCTKTLLLARTVQSGLSRDGNDRLASINDDDEDGGRVDGDWILDGKWLNGWIVPDPWASTSAPPIKTRLNFRLDFFSI